MTPTEAAEAAAAAAEAAAAEAAAAATRAYVAACSAACNAKVCDDAHYAMHKANQAHAYAIAAWRVAQARVDAERKTAALV